MRIRWTNKALDNLDQAIEYIATNNPATAQKVAQSIQESIELLEDQPGIGRPGRVSGTRELVLTGLPYIVPYIEKNDTIIILRILHTSMKWPASLK
jgi:addiction module RelE/StbE family toxin